MQLLIALMCIFVYKSKNQDALSSKRAQCMLHPPFFLFSLVFKNKYTSMKQSYKTQAKWVLNQLILKFQPCCILVLLMHFFSLFFALILCSEKKNYKNMDKIIEPRAFKVQLVPPNFLCNCVEIAGKREVELFACFFFFSVTQTDPNA